MFINFQFGNFRSFRDLQTLTMAAAPVRSNDSGMEGGNVFKVSSLRLLKAKAIYGSNASGKSNIIKALDAFYNMVNISVIQEGLAEEIWNDRFLLIANWDDRPIFFQYIFLHDEVIYRYGFQILDGKVTYEWLFTAPNEEERKFFMRTPEELEVHEEHLVGFKTFTKRALESGNELYRHDSLLLTAGALNANKLLANIRNEIKSMILVGGINDYAGAQYAMRQIVSGSNEKKKAIVDFLSAADTGIEGLAIKSFPHNVSKSSRSISDDRLNGLKGRGQFTLFSIHSKYDENGALKDKTMVPFGEWESEGTEKLFGIGLLLLEALEQGRSFIIDEFDARFHANLTLKIVQMFLDPKTNPKNAQLIFVSHESGLLRRAEWRRDQICFVDKNQYGISHLTNLVEYKSVRKDASYEKEYLSGSYGAVPFLDKMKWVVRRKDEP